MYSMLYPQVLMDYIPHSYNKSLTSRYCLRSEQYLTTSYEWLIIFVRLVLG